MAEDTKQTEAEAPESEELTAEQDALIAAHSRPSTASFYMFPSR
jgi:hypothetical protein